MISLCINQLHPLVVEPLIIKRVHKYSYFGGLKHSHNKNVSSIQNSDTPPPIHDCILKRKYRDGGRGEARNYEDVHMHQDPLISERPT